MNNNIMKYFRFPSIKSGVFLSIFFITALFSFLLLIQKARVASDDNRIVFSSSEITGTDQVYTIKSDGTDNQQLTSDPAGSSYPAWSYDHSKIAYSHAGQIWVMDANGANKIQLTSSSGSNFGPSFSPDGTKIVFTSLRTGNPEIWKMDANGDNEQQLTTTTVGSYTRNGEFIIWGIHGNYSSNGTKIAYASTQSGRSQIWVMNADGSGKTQLTFPTDPAHPDANAPSWSPDGTKIAFWSGYETEFGEIFTMNANGTGRTQITFQSEPINSDGPAWSPDGQKIIFESLRPPYGYQIMTFSISASGGENTLQVLLPFGYGAGRLPWAGDDVVYSREAEDGTLSGTTFQIGVDGGASWTMYVWAPDLGSGIKSCCQSGATIPVVITYPGNYYIWGRYRNSTTNSTSDTLYVRIDGGTTKVWDMSPDSLTWKWDQVNDQSTGQDRVFNLSQGSHNIEFYEREDGAQLDCILLIRTNQAFVPSSISHCSL